jgi:L-asparaginase/Glu-tRNA(Gln) amidotransferase subunit D
MDLINRGPVSVGDLSAYQARHQLQALLVQDADRETIAEKFAAFAQ